MQKDPRGFPSNRKKRVFAVGTDSNYFLDSRTARDMGNNPSKHKNVLGVPIEVIETSGIKPNNTVPKNTAIVDKKDQTIIQEIDFRKIQNLEWKEYILKQIEDKKESKRLEKLQSEQQDRRNLLHLLTKEKPPISAHVGLPVKSHRIHHYPETVDNIHGRTNEQLANASIYKSKIPVSAALQLLLKKRGELPKRLEPTKLPIKNTLSTPGEPEQTKNSNINELPVRIAEKVYPKPDPIINFEETKKEAPSSVSHAAKQKKVAPVVDFDNIPIHPPKKDSIRKDASNSNNFKHTATGRDLQEKRAKSAEKQVFNDNGPKNFGKKSPLNTTKEHNEPKQVTVNHDDIPIRPAKQDIYESVDKFEMGVGHTNEKLKPHKEYHGIKKSAGKLSKSTRDGIPKTGHMDILPEDKETLKHLQAIQKVLEEEIKFTK